MSDLSRTALAQARAAAARARLAGTIDDLQERLDPRTVANDAIEGLAEGGRKAVSVGIDAARRNPVPLAGAIAVAAAFLGRHRIAALFRRSPRTPEVPISPPKPQRASRVRTASPRRSPAKRTQP